MSVSILPTEILDHIFRMLDGESILQCQQVCQRWKTITEDLNDCFWKTICSREHDNVLEAYRKSKLSWYELYKSLNLWLQVSSANVRVYDIPTDGTSRFFIEKGAVCDAQRSVLNERYDSIVYYDLDSLKETHRYVFDFTFHTYNVTDKVIVLFKKDVCDELSIILKKTKECIFAINPMKHEWVLFQDDIYYKTRDTMFCVKFYSDTNKCEIIEYPGLPIEAYIADLKRNKKGQISILMKSYKEKIIYSISNEELITEKRVTRTPMQRLESNHGFQMEASDIMEYFEQLKINYVHVYGKIIIIGIRKPEMIQIYKLPDENLSELKGASPLKSINLDELRESKLQNQTLKIDVVETVRGNNIILWCFGNLSVIELSHNTNK